MDRRRLAVVALVFALVPACGCTGQGDDAAAPAQSPSQTPAPSSSPPETQSPDEHQLGEAAALRLRTSSGKSSRVRVAVTEVTEGKIAQLSNFELDAETRRSTPYYATVRVRNVGEGDLSGARITLWGLDSEGTVRPPADVVGGFPRCEPRPMPDKFRSGKSARTCLTYLLPKGTTLEAVQYRFEDRPPISWPVG